MTVKNIAILVILLLASLSVFAGFKSPQQVLCVIRSYDEKMALVDCDKHKDYYVPINAVRTTPKTQIMSRQKVYVWKGLLKTERAPTSSR